MIEHVENAFLYETLGRTWFKIGAQRCNLRPHGRSEGREIKRQHITGIWNFRGPRGFILKRTRAQAAMEANNIFPSYADTVDSISPKTRVF